MPGSLVQLVFDGVADGPVGVALDVANAARRIAAARQGNVAKSRVPPPMRLVSIDGAPVRTSAKRTLPVDGALDLRALRKGDVLVLPGLEMGHSFELATPLEIDAALERPDIAKARRLLARAAAKGVLVAASCAATFVLASSGVLDGREATTTWWLGPVFARRFPRVTLRTDRMVVSSGDVFTAGSAFAHADLMLAIVAHTMSPSVAHRIAQYLVLDERASQSRYMVLDHLRSADPVIRALERFIGSNLERQVTAEEMARATATSPRTLARKLERALGTTPLRFAQRLRIAHAVHLLEATGHPVEEIASRVGYADAAAFRRIFRRETGEAPHARRARAQSAVAPKR